MRKFLEGTLGHPVISFGYPYGYQPDYDETGEYVTRSVEAAGYWFARTTANGPNTIDGIKQPLALSPDFHFNAGAATISTRFAELSKKEGVVFEVWGTRRSRCGDSRSRTGGDRRETRCLVCHRRRRVRLALDAHEHPDRGRREGCSRYDVQGHPAVVASLSADRTLCSESPGRRYRSDLEGRETSGYRWSCRPYLVIVGIGHAPF